MKNKFKLLLFFIIILCFNSICYAGSASESWTFSDLMLILNENGYNYEYTEADFTFVNTTQTEFERAINSSTNAKFLSKYNTNGEQLSYEAMLITTGAFFFSYSANANTNIGIEETSYYISSSTTKYIINFVSKTIERKTSTNIYDVPFFKISYYNNITSTEFQSRELQKQIFYKFFFYDAGQARYYGTTDIMNQKTSYAITESTVDDVTYQGSIIFNTLSGTWTTTLKTNTFKNGNYQFQLREYIIDVNNLISTNYSLISVHDINIANYENFPIIISQPFKEKVDSKMKFDKQHVYTLVITPTNSSNILISSELILPTNYLIENIRGFENSHEYIPYYRYQEDKPIVDSGQTGTITNPSGETTGSVDLSGIQAGIQGIQGTIENAIGEGSGEITQEDIDKLKNETTSIINNIVPANTYLGMFNQIVQGFTNALLGEGEEFIEFDYMGKHYIIGSSQIRNPIDEIRIFTGLFTDVAIIMAMALTVTFIIRRMEEGDVISVLSLGDADMYFYDDLQLF